MGRPGVDLGSTLADEFMKNRLIFFQRIERYIGTKNLVNQNPATQNLAQSSCLEEYILKTSKLFEIGPVVIALWSLEIGGKSLLFPYGSLVFGGFVTNLVF